jgi:Fe-S-cluster containining protein
VRPGRQNPREKSARWCRRDPRAEIACEVHGGWYLSLPVSADRRTPWKTSPARAELLALYARVDALLAPYSCDASTDCCRFGVTGREPYVTPPEIAEVERAVAALGGERALASKRTLPIASRAEGERRCAMLDDAGRCRIYESRPLGCRTFFCERVRGPGRVPRDEIQRIARAVADLAARFAPHDPHARPFSRVFGAPRGR